MNKLKLRLDDLRVDSFIVSAELGGQGTVDGHQITIGCTGNSPTCNGIMTCNGNSCRPSHCGNFTCNSCPCQPPGGSADCGTDTIYSDVGASCSGCNQSVNNVNTCVAPCQSFYC